jgi:hypothetical protein
MAINIAQEMPDVQVWNFRVPFTSSRDNLLLLQFRRSSAPNWAVLFVTLLR